MRYGMKEVADAVKGLVEPVFRIPKSCIRPNQLWAAGGVRIQLFEY